MAKRLSPRQHAQLRTRIRQTRTRLFGERGAARFARAIGVSPSTYRAYESDRTPPATVLAHISDVSGVDPRWLLTGQFEDAAACGGPCAINERQRRILARFAESLSHRVPAVSAMVALIDLLEGYEEILPVEPTPPSASRPASLTPVLGRTAAGLPCFWKNDADGPSTLDAWPTIRGKKNSIPAEAIDDASDLDASGRQVRIVQRAEPVTLGNLSVSSFLFAPAIRKRHPDAFALQVDGDSMAPAIEHGDYVVVSPSAPARDARPAVVQLRRQMGLVCKLFRRSGDRIHLIPINDAFPVTRRPAADVVWALDVLFRVRPAND